MIPKDQGPVVQSVIRLMSSLMVKILTVLVSTISNYEDFRRTNVRQVPCIEQKNSQVFLLQQNCEYLLQIIHIFSAKILGYMPYLMINILTIR